MTIAHKKRKVHGSQRSGIKSRALSRLGPVRVTRHVPLSGETKVYDISETTTTFQAESAPPTGISLFQPVTGTDISQRIGRKCNLKSLYFNGTIGFHGQTPGIDPIPMRVVVLYDNQPNGAAPAFSDVWLDLPSGSSLALSNLNPNNKDRFKILIDHRVNGGSYATSTETTINRFVPLKGMEVMFNSTNGGTIADITTGSVILFVFCATQQANALIWSSRIRYSDV